MRISDWSSDVCSSDLEVNLRTGPGPTYPIEWVYLRRNMPVEIVAEFDNWRKIRDWQGTVGWVHQNLLSGERYARIANAERVLLSRAGDGTPEIGRAHV